MGHERREAIQINKAVFCKGPQVEVPVQVRHAVRKEGTFNKGLQVGGNNIKRHITKGIRGQWVQGDNLATHHMTDACVYDF